MIACSVNRLFILTSRIANFFLRSSAIFSRISCCLMLPSARARSSTCAQPSRGGEVGGGVVDEGLGTTGDET